MHDRQFLIIYNPAAGKKGTKRLINDISAFFRDKNLIGEFHSTYPNISAGELVKSTLKSYHSDVVVIGGDGTINQVVNALPHSVPLSIVPCGTGNDIVKRIPVGKTLNEQLHTLLYGTSTSFTLGECNGRKFVNGVGIGFDGQIVKEMSNQNPTLLTGQAKYYYHVIKILGSYTPKKMHWVADQKMEEKSSNILMTVALGTTFGGGFRLTPHAKGDKLAVCAIADLSPIMRFLNIHLLQKGQHSKLSEVNLFECQDLNITTDPNVYGHIDGELLNPSQNYTFTMSSSTLLVRCL